MSLKAPIAVIAVVISVLAAPALANDANVAAVLRDNVGADNIAAYAPQQVEPWRANARAFGPANIRTAQDRAWPTTNVPSAFDIRLLGHN